MATVDDRQRKLTMSQRRRLADPIQDIVSFDETESKMAIASHPIHAMMVAFPIALAFSALGADVMYWVTGDVFWPRVAMYAVGVAFVMGVLAGIAGTVELLSVRGIRIRSASWTHFILAMVLLSVLGLNWGFRWADPVAAVLPWGFLLSLLTAGMTAITGWHGGKLVFDYGIGMLSRAGRGKTGDGKTGDDTAGDDKSLEGKIEEAGQGG